MISVRRAAAALAAGAVLSTTAAGVAAAAPSPTPSPVTVPAGLYGTSDPTYDGVWRQSLAFLAQRTSGIQPADQAVDWLLGQQCANGGFAAYRPDPAKACDATTMVDSNSTAAAVQALGAVKRQSVAPAKNDKAVKAGVEWLKSVQNKDGGWGYMPGGPSDANSTSIVIGAFAASGVRPGLVKSADGKTPYDALLTFALPCTGGTEKAAGGEADKAAAGTTDKTAAGAGGAFAYQPDKNGKLLANADATAAATLAGLGKGITARGADPEQKPVCTDQTGKPTPERAALNGASYLAAQLAKTGHLVAPPMPGAAEPAELPDYGNTADAVVALAASGAKKEAGGALAWLEKNAATWAETNGPAAYAQLVFAAHAMDTDPRAFGTVDLLKKLNATGPEPKAPDNSQASAGADEDEGGFDLWWIIGIGTVVGVGIGFLLSGRKK
ncbi:prenyltransferase/squalene oxidase repeat-containing protein [Streptomyces roseicoloratus]|uniref:Prenyltransferase/squalene oxidase repeat-containing protein n=1 Tax=Streptomyces roseicoloratus TaxID=2508722 RepID=A0ABY9RYN2_9ACTN|nr:prenyltransferase/squalene oxidase repeat-containing protein [Streptomyces roseicoloratus]WMX47287.1 prenyltransferase/squalene oxidase repeat-containing protein [Streptomyces roseicoloratus]